MLNIRYECEDKSYTFMEAKKPAQKKGTPDKNVTITARRAATFYVFVAKQALNNFETIELHALGLAMSTCVSAADLLMKYKDYARLV